ncbi:dynein light chain roadblock-type 1 [Nannochloropsis oceanica]
MSQVEETIERIKIKQGIEGYVITNKKGQVLRRFHTMSEERADAMAATVRQLALKAQNVARDLDPSVSLCNEFQYLRIKTKKHEVIAAIDNEFLVTVLQRWTPSSA